MEIPKLTNHLHQSENFPQTKTHFLLQRLKTWEQKLTESFQNCYDLLFFHWKIFIFEKVDFSQTKNFNYLFQILKNLGTKITEGSKTIMAVFILNWKIFISKKDFLQTKTSLYYLVNFKT